MKQRPLPKIRRFLSVALLTTLVATPLARSYSTTEAQAKTASEIRPYSAKPSKDALKWADKELRRMSLEQKIGQLISVGVNATFLNQESEAFRSLKRQVEENHIGGIILFRGPVYESVVLM